jgi:hypothetical protein
MGMNAVVESAATLERSLEHPPDQPPDYPTARWVASLVMLASLVLVLWNLQDASLENANTGSRYATIESLVDYGTFAIDQSRYSRTIDKVKVGDHYYSSKPPVLSVYGAGVYWVYRALSGHTIADYEGEVVWVVSLATGWLSHAVLLVYLRRIGQLLFRRQLATLGMLIAAGFGYLGAGYATTLNNHSVAAAFVVAGLYHVQRARRTEGWRHWSYAGLWLGFVPSLDLPSTAFAVAFGAYLLRRDWRRTLRCFVPAALPPFILGLVLNVVSTGSVIPAYLRAELYKYAGSYWQHTQGIDALREPKGLYAFHVLLGHHGVFSMTPLLVFAVIELVREVRRGEDRAVSVANGAALAAVLAFLIFWSTNYGGWCVGMRWFVPPMAVLLVYFGYWLERVPLSRLQNGLVMAAFAVSAYNTQDALSGPFQYSRWHNWLENAPNRFRTGAKQNLGRAHARARKAAAAAATAPPAAEPAAAVPPAAAPGAP